MNEQTAMMNQQKQLQLMNMNPNMVSVSQMHSQPQPQVNPMNRGYGGWPPQPQFQNPNPGAMKPPPSGFKKSLGPRNNWKGKKVNKLNDKRRDQQKFLMSGSSSGIAGGVNMIGGGGIGNLKFNNYQPPTLNELQYQNRLKTRKYFPKKKFNKNINQNMNMGVNNNNYCYNNNSRSAPFAPRNTTSFLIRAKKSGGIASMVSPSPMTPAVLPTPIFSPSREVLVDMAKEEWGVDGYGSMKGLIRLRSPGHEIEANEEEYEDASGSSESDVEEHVEVERRLDHDLSRFEMIYDPNNISGVEHHNVLENRVDDQDTHIAQLEEENLILKERLFLMERELEDLRRRMQFLEQRGNKAEEFNEEVVENDSENESGSRGDGTNSMEDNEEFNEDDMAHINELAKERGGNVLNSEVVEPREAAEKDVFGLEEKAKSNNDEITEVDMNTKIIDVEGGDGSKHETISADLMEKKELSKDINENNGDNNKYMDVETKALDVVLEDSEQMASDNICLEDVGVARVDKHAKATDVEGEGENKNEIIIGGAELAKNKESVEVGEANSDSGNKCLDVEMKAVDNVDIGPSEHVARGEICMEDVGVTATNTVWRRDAAN